MVLHAVEDDHAVAWRFDSVLPYFELTTHPEIDDLGLDQALGGLLQGALQFANADDEHATFAQAFLYGEFSEEMGFSRAAAAVSALVAGGIKQRAEDRRRRNLKRAR